MIDPDLIDADDIADLVVEIYDMHERIIEQTGGLPGLRDAALLHAAVARPFASLVSEPLYPSDFEKAAALFHSLIKSHPFMDGTKRTAFMSTLHMLENFGYTIPAVLPENEVIRFCLAVAEENMRIARGEPIIAMTIPQIADWFRQLLRSEF